jgi:hypothetical protein
MDLEQEIINQYLETLQPRVTGERTNAMSEALGIGDISQTVTEVVSEGMAGVKSDFEKDPVQATYGLAKGRVEGAVGLPGDLLNIVKGVYEASQTPEGASKIESFLTGISEGNIIDTESIGDFVENTLGLPKSSAEYAEGLGELIAPAKFAGKSVKAITSNKAKSTATAATASAPAATKEKAKQ